METTATSVERPQRADARRNRQRILDAARRVFAAEGIDSQMDAVARTAGVGVGTVYRHFPDKEALLGELVREKFARLGDLVGEALETEGEPFELLSALLHRHCEEVEGDAGLQHALKTSGEGVWGRAATERAELEQLTAELMRRAVDQGTLRTDARVADIGLIMCGVSATMALADEPGGWRRHLELALDGLRPRTGS